MFSDIIQDKEGIIWIASALDGGLIRLNKNTNEIRSYRNDEEDKYSISFNALKAIAVDSQNNIWIGSQYGLNKFDRSTERFHKYTEDSVYQIILYMVF